MDHGHGDTMMTNGSMAMDDSSFCQGTGRVMLSGFQVALDDNPCVLFLFRDAVVDSATRYAFAVIGTFLMALLVELLRWTRSHTSRRGFGFAKAWGPLTLDAAVCLLFATQMVLAYWLMLLVMLYEGVIFTAIILGLTAGLFATRVLDRRCFPGEEHVVAAANTPCCDGCECTPTQVTKPVVMQALQASRSCCSESDTQPLTAAISV